jgi:hypothetical protein
MKKENGVLRCARLRNEWIEPGIALQIVVTWYPSIEMS